MTTTPKTLNHTLATITVSTRKARAIASAIVITLAGAIVTPLAAETVTYEYDPNGNVLVRQTPSQTDTAGYDAENRTTLDTSGDGLTRQFTYDANGNRIQYRVDTFSETLGYSPNTNRLTNRDAQAIQTDAAGNITDDGQYLYTYNNAGRLKQINRKSDNTLIATYIYNGLGLRTRKVTPEGTTRYQYDLDGRLIVETSDTGATKEYLYLENRPIAQIDTNGQIQTITYLHTDHLDTPRVGTDANQTVVWSWKGEAFGSLQPDQGGVTVNLRFAGQYFDGESGLYYNWNNYYDPKTGRWLTVDRMSVAEHVRRWQASLGRPGQTPLEINPYAALANNPLRWIDPTGLGAWDKLYGLPKQFWKWFHRHPDFEDLKGPGGQVPKDVAKDYHKEWEGLGKPGPDSKGKQGGFIDPDLLPSLLTPWWLTPSELGMDPCELPGGPACGPQTGCQN